MCCTLCAVPNGNGVLLSVLRYRAITLFDCRICGRYFCGVASTPNQQRMLLEQFFNDCFKKNKAEVKKLRFEGTRSGLNNNSSKGRGFGKAETAEDKKKRYGQNILLADTLLTKVDVLNRL